MLHLDLVRNFQHTSEQALDHLLFLIKRRGLWISQNQILRISNDSNEGHQSKSRIIYTILCHWEDISMLASVFCQESLSLLKCKNNQMEAYTLFRTVCSLG